MFWHFVISQLIKQMKNSFLSNYQLTIQQWQLLSIIPDVIQLCHPPQMDVFLWMQGLSQYFTCLVHHSSSSVIAARLDSQHHSGQRRSPERQTAPRRVSEQQQPLQNSYVCRQHVCNCCTGLNMSKGDLPFFLNLKPIKYLKRQPNGDTASRFGLTN